MFVLIRTTPRRFCWDILPIFLHRQHSNAAEFPDFSRRWRQNGVQRRYKIPVRKLNRILTVNSYLTAGSLEQVDALIDPQQHYYRNGIFII